MSEFKLENTPNPNTIKVNIGQLIYAGTIEYQKNKNTNSEFANEIFKIDGIDGIFILKDFLTITKSDESSFKDLTPSALEIIQKFITENKSFGESEMVEEEDRDYNELELKIVDVLDKYVRPAVAQDGGDVTFDSFKDGTVYLQMKGSCSGCPSSVMTLKNGIERMMTNFVPEVHSVEAV
jgi:NFU1 iron-sulfur cluster scaffold homolog, mitochondrial